MQQLRLHITIIILLSLFCKSKALSRKMKSSAVKPGRILALDVADVPRINISSYCQNLFVHILCENSSYAYSSGGPCTACSITDFYKRFCGSTSHTRFSASMPQKTSEENMNKAYCEGHNYNFKINATAYLEQNPDFKAQCQHEVDALCPSLKPVRFHRREKEEVFSRTHNYFLKQLRQDAKKWTLDKYRNRKNRSRKQRFERPHLPKKVKGTSNLYLRKINTRRSRAIVYDTEPQIPHNEK